MNIAIYGGTFNPVHKGHINCIDAVMRYVRLDKVIVLPDRIPPHKSSIGLAGGKDRLEMCRLAFEKIKNVEVSDWELKQNKKSYSVVALRHFHRQYPKDKLYFIMGSDMLMGFECWYEYKEILRLAALLCVSREKKDTIQKLQTHANKIMKECGGQIIIVSAEPFEISSTQIRKMIENYEDPSCYLDENVVQYILDNDLYHDGAAPYIESQNEVV